MVSEPLAPRNADFESGDWLKSIIWDADRPYKDFTKVNLNLNDVQMLLEVQTDARTYFTSLPHYCWLAYWARILNSQLVLSTEPTEVNLTLNTIEREAGLDPLNFSNDREYAVTKDTKKKIRQTFGQLEVQHAYPAQKLQLPFVR